KPFRPWGVNYDHHDPTGALLEDYWADQWGTVVEDFDEIAALGANTVRIHLQLAQFMETAEKPNAANLARLTRLLRLADEKGLYLDLTGLGCYHKQDVPEWYEALPEQERWTVQARFWEAIAKTCAASPAVFCYDLMNEPILPGRKPEKEWLTGELGGKHFVQRLSLDLGDRSREEVARVWVERMTASIRKHDTRHLITVGVIPWALTWPGARPIFYSEAVGRNLDFVSVHFYPNKGGIDEALTALKTYDLGKPLVVEEFFPLRCSAEELERFMAEASKNMVDGWISFYWGRTPAEYAADPESGLAGALKAAWIRRFKALSSRYGDPPRLSPGRP
ncbi:MAG: cellulase family glycosylhydrolase, partial [Akkermansiaceae bacterium]|nr:cellulase family glycosylhydrolase [Akkermansiaceae bacterium]